MAHTLNQVRAIVDDAYRLADSLGYCSDLEDAIDKATKDERAHRRMGARFTGGQAGYRGSCRLAATLLVCRAMAACLNSDEPGALDACEVRDDIRIAWRIVLRARRAAVYGDPISTRLIELEDYPILGLDVLRARRAAVYGDLTSTRLIQLAKHPILGLDYARDIAVHS